MEHFPQHLVLLLSVDIVGSAEFKAKNSSVLVFGHSQSALLFLV